MSGTERIHEENVARLVQAACGPEARPSQAARTRVLSVLMAEAHTHPAPAPFPDAAVALLGVFIVLAGVWLAVRAASGASHPALAIVAATVALNLILAPVAGAAIVWHRRRYA